MNVPPLAPHGAPCPVARHEAITTRPGGEEDTAAAAAADGAHAMASASGPVIGGSRMVSSLTIGRL
jgi:hypothetical protein